MQLAVCVLPPMKVWTLTNDFVTPASPTYAARLSWRYTLLRHLFQYCIHRARLHTAKSSHVPRSSSTVRPVPQAWVSLCSKGGNATHLHCYSTAATWF